MKKFVVYDATGRILRSGFCQDGLVAAQVVNDGEFAMEGEGNDLEHYVSLSVPGKPIICRKAKPEEEYVARWLRPE